MRALEDERVDKVAKYLEGRAERLSLWVDELRVDLDMLKEDLTAEGQLNTSNHSLLQRIIGYFGQSSKEGEFDGVDLACWFKRALEEYDRLPAFRDKRPLARLLTGLYGMLRSQFGDRTDELMERVFSVIENRYRASSLVENLNGRLRPYVETHRCVSQGFLDLFMAHRNLKRPGCGKVRELSPYERLTGERVDDWLTKLGYAPSA